MSRGRRKLSGLLALVLALLLVCLPAAAAELGQASDQPETQQAAERTTPEGEEKSALEPETEDTGEKQLVPERPEDTAETEPTQEETEEPVPEPAELPEGVEAQYSVTYGAREQWDLLQTAFDQKNRPEGELTFTLVEEEENPNPVLEIDAQTGVFTAIRAGTAQVRIVEAQGEKRYAYTVQVTVEKGTQVVTGLEDSYAASYSGQSYDWGKLVRSSGDGELTFASSDPKVATVDPKTGVVKQVAAGTATITVTAGETERYQAGSISSILTIHKGTQTISGLNAGYTVKYAGKTYNWGKVVKTSGDGALTYVSSNPKVATVDPKTGVVKQAGVGTTTITVTAAETARYRAASVASVLTVQKGTQTISGLTTGYTVKYAGKTYNWGKVVKTSGDGKLTYLSSNPKVATVDKNTGVIKQVGVGTTTITVTAGATERYQQAVYRSTLRINKGTQQIKGVGARYCVSYRAGKRYDWGKCITATGKGALTFASSNPKVAVVDPKTGIITQKGVGTTKITITASATALYQKQVFQSELVIKQAQVLSEIKSGYTVNYVQGKFYNWGKVVKCTGNGKLSYTSSNPAVATVNQNGVISVKGVGTTQIVIRAAESDRYAPAGLVSTLTINKGIQSITGLKSAYSVAYQKGKTYNWGRAIKVSGPGAVTYSSSDPRVIAVDAKTGVLTQKSAGKAVITVRAAETPLYREGKVSSTLFVNKQTPTLGGVKPSYRVAYVPGRTYNWGKVVTNSGNGRLTFTSSNPAVAVVDAKTGVITQKGVGTTTITITSAETEEYYKAAITSELSIGFSPAAYNFSTAYRNSVYYQRLMSTSLGSSQRSNILAIARSQVGYTEGNSISSLNGSAGGSGNYTEFGRWYYYNVDSSDVFYKGAWCSMFASWCANEAGISTSIVPRRALVAYMKDAYSAQGRYYTWSQSKCGGGGKKIQPGDFIIYSATPSGRYNHIGIVSSVVYNGSRVTINTVEGNVENTCVTRRWTISTGSGGRIDSSHYIRGFCCPNYSS